jgi:hypothetical protein
VNATVGGAGSGGDYGPGVGSEAIDPFTGSDGLAGFGVGAEGGPIALILIMFIWNGAFDDQNEIV